MLLLRLLPRVKLKMDHPFLRATGDIVAWGILGAAIMGYLTKLAVILGVAWHLYQFYCALEKRLNKRKQYKRRKTDAV
jgi:hypothetical protein